MIELPPALPLLLGAFVALALRGRLRGAWLVALPVVSWWLTLQWSPGDVRSFAWLGTEFVWLRVDALTMVFSHVFHLAAFLSAIYAWHEKDVLQPVTGTIYAGAAIAALFAGDLLTLFVYWELTAVASVFLIWAARTKRAYRAGMRYLVIQVGSGVLLLAGAILRYQETGSLTFERMTLGEPGAWPIFLAFGIKAAFPLLHNWLQDAYPESTAVGTVFLSAFTTKLAIYALARGFAGTESLIWIGAAMTAFPIFFAVIENDLRRVLAYSLNNQLGFMVVGIGIGTELSLNGTASHAFAHVIYKALLFMSMGAVLHRTGTCKGTDLGGLFRSMPFTAVCCIVGAVSISGFPLTSGFVSKSMILSGAAEGHLTLTWLVLLLASAGVLEHSGIKVPFFAFFAHDSGRRVEEAPWNMRIAMGIAAALCLLIGCAPGLLYGLLPYPVDYVPYTAGHVITQLQLLMWAVLAFAVLKRYGWYPPELRSTILDTDWTYRRLIPRIGRVLAPGFHGALDGLDGALDRLGRTAVRGVERFAGPAGPLGRTHAAGVTVLWIVVVFGMSLLLYSLR